MAYSIVERTDQPYGPWYDFATASGVYNWGYSDANDGAWGYLQLYDSGCKVGNGWNCTAACLDTELGPNLLWNTTNTGYTLQNCIVLPFIAALLAASDLTPTAVKLAQKYQIAPDASLFNSSNASAISWPVINNCINQFCEGNGGSTPGCDTSHAPNQDAMLWYTFTPNETYYQDGDGQNYTQNITFDGVRVDGRKKRTYVTDVQSGYLQLWTLLQSQCWVRLHSSSVAIALTRSQYVCPLPAGGSG